MKYFIDTEFIEGFHKPLFGKRRHFIDLISIGIVCEDGREYYAISKEYRFKDADKWVQDNVIIPMYTQEISGFKRDYIKKEDFHKYIPNGKSNDDIRSKLFQFITCPKGDTVEFYGYYSDYDWVLLCSLFGRMIDLPKGFPMYCVDLKQMIDERANKIEVSTVIRGVNTFDEKLDFLKKHPEYPKQKDEHNALADAKWNHELFKFLKKIT